MAISIKHSFPLRSLWSSRFRHESVRLSHSMVWVRLEALKFVIDSFRSGTPFP